MPLILPGNVATALGGDFEVANSCRFDGTSAYLHKSTSSGTNTKFTFSAWIKRSSSGSNYPRILGSYTDGSNYLRLNWNRAADGEQLHLYSEAGTAAQLLTNRRFRDPTAWMHIVVAVDTTDGTANDRMKMYINGVQETSFATRANPDQNADFKINNASSTITVGKKEGADSDYFDGYMAEVVFIDGTQYAASDFGEFDEDSPRIWKPKAVSGLTFGTNGFYLDFEASANLGNDANGGTDLTEVNLAAIDQCVDTCTNNFATFNPLVVINGSAFSEGNCKVVTGSSPYSYDVSTFGVSAGKWYVEAKYGGSSDDATFGIAGRTATDTTHELGQYDDTWSYYTGTGASNVRNNNSNSSYGNTYAADDIIGLALDLTNNKLYFSKNGTWQNSGDPTSGSTGTGAVTITAASGVTDGVYYIGIGDFDGGASVTWEINFGNPSFSISSGNADGNGYGNFEYAPPSGYLSLCTKNLGSDGG